MIGRHASTIRGRLGGFVVLFLLTGSRAAGSSAAPVEAPQAPQAHVYRTIEGRALKAYLFEPKRPGGTRPAPAILLFHGGGWVAGSAEWTFDSARRFAKLGLVAISVDYRLSEGETTPIEALEDTCAAFRWARDHAGELGLDPARVAGHGVSAGGQLLAAAATLGCGAAGAGKGNGGPDALLLWSPALDMAQDGFFKRLLQGRAPPLEYSPVEHVHAAMPPVSIVQGAEDRLTPLSGARLFCERVTKQGGRCELNVYPGLGHLLTRNLENQEDDFDPDPEARADGTRMQNEFIQGLWLRPGR